MASDRLYARQDLASCTRRKSARSEMAKLLSAVPRGRKELFIESPSGKNIESKPMSLSEPGNRLVAIERLDLGDPPESYRRYGFRSFDRQYIIADSRLMDRAASVFWRGQGSHQVWLTTVIRTKLGTGPALTATPYVPDLHHYNGRGDMGKVALFRDVSADQPNVTVGLLATLSEKLDTEITAEELLAYVYALGGTAAFSYRFNKELAEAAGPIHIPMTASLALFQQAVDLGRDLLWWHTWGERFASGDKSRLPDGPAKEVCRVDGMPTDYAYDADSHTLTVGAGDFAPVSPEAWNFEVSGLKVLRSLARLPNEDPQGQEIESPRRHPAHPLDADRRTPPPPRHPRAHHRGHPHRRRSPRRNPRQPPNPRHRPPNPNPRPTQGPQVTVILAQSDPLTRLWLPRTAGRRTSPTTTFSASCWHSTAACGCRKLGRGR